MSLSKVGSFSRQKTAGQALIEYILLMIVVVAVILGLMTQFGTPFRDWAKNYFGEYLACVIETGELPSLGGQGGVSNSECNEYFQPFTLAAGRPPRPGGGNNGGGSGGGGSSGGGSGSSNADNEDSQSNEGGKNKNFAGASNRKPRTANRFTPGQRGDLGSNKNGNGQGEGANNKKRYTGSTETSTPGWALGSKKRMELNKQGFVDGGFSYQSERRTDEVENNRVVLKKSSKGQSKKAKKMLIERRVAEKSQTEDKDPEFTLGNFIKYILIIAILIFLLIFLGGEVMNINKSMDS